MRCRFCVAVHRGAAALLHELTPDALSLTIEAGGVDTGEQAIGRNYEAMMNIGIERITVNALSRDDRGDEPFAGECAHNVGNRKWATLTWSMMIDRSRRIERIEIEADRVEHIGDSAASKAMQENAAITELANRKRRAAILVTGASPEPAVGARSPDAVEPSEQRVDAHRATSSTQASHPSSDSLRATAIASSRMR